MAPLKKLRGRPVGSRSKVIVPKAAQGFTARVVGYVRVSTDQQADEGVSLDAQRAKLRAHCVAMDLELVAVEADEGASAKTLERPGLQRALAMLTNGQADALLIPKLDRLTRRVIDLGQLIENYFAGERWSLLSVADSIDTRTASGRLVLYLLMTVAQWERETIGERTKAAMDFLRLAGVTVGRAALGLQYATEVDPSGRRIVEIVDEEAATVARITELRGSGLSYAKVASAVGAEGHQTKLGGRWHANTVRMVCLRATHPAAVQQQERSL